MRNLSFSACAFRRFFCILAYDLVRNYTKGPIFHTNESLVVFTAL